MSEIVPPLFRDLRELAGNYWWSWQLDGPEVFRDISRSLWEACGHNPRKLLDETVATRLTELDIDPHYRARAQDLLGRFRAAMQPRIEPIPDSTRPSPPSIRSRTSRPSSRSTSRCRSTRAVSAFSPAIT